MSVVIRDIYIYIYIIHVCQVLGVKCGGRQVGGAVTGISMNAGALVRHRACMASLSSMSTRLSKNVERSAQQALGILLGASWEALPGCGGPLEGSGTVLGRLLGGSWQAFGGFQEASWTKDRHGYNF